MSESEMRIDIDEIGGRFAVNVTVAAVDSSQPEEGEQVSTVAVYDTRPEAEAFRAGAEWGIVGTVRLLDTEEE